MIKGYTACNVDYDFYSMIQEKICQVLKKAIWKLDNGFLIRIGHSNSITFFQSKPKWTLHVNCTWNA